MRQRFFLVLSLAVIGAYWATTVTCWALDVSLITAGTIRELILRYVPLAATEVAVMWLLLRGAGQRLVDLGCRPRDFRLASRPDVARVIGFAMLLNIVVGVVRGALTAVGAATPTEPGLSPAMQMLTRDPHDWIWWFAAALIGGVLEELERAFCLTRMEQAFGRYGLVATVVIDSATFGLRHHYQGTAGVLHAAVMGIVWCLLFLRRRRVAEPMLAHVGYDLLVIPALYVR